MCNVRNKKSQPLLQIALPRILLHSLARNKFITQGQQPVFTCQCAEGNCNVIHQALQLGNLSFFQLLPLTTCPQCVFLTPGILPAFSPLGMGSVGTSQQGVLPAGSHVLQSSLFTMDRFEFLDSVPGIFIFLLLFMFALGDMLGVLL